MRCLPLPTVPVPPRRPFLPAHVASPPQTAAPTAAAATPPPPAPAPTTVDKEAEATRFKEQGMVVLLGWVG